MILYMKKYIFGLGLLIFFASNTSAQEKITQQYSLNQVFELAEQHNQSLRLGKSATEIAKQQVEVVKLQQLPSATATLSGGYLGNVMVIDKDFSDSKSIQMPHFSNAFSVQASQVIFKGNAINNNIASASLQEQIAVLKLQENELAIKLLVAGNYYDLFKLYNQRKVYEQNIQLAELRLKQVKQFYEKGMVTKNDVLRSELNNSDLKLAIISIDNNINIINKQLTMAIGLPENTYIMPDTTVLDNHPEILPLQHYREIALAEYPSIQTAYKQIELSEKHLEITKADRLPTLSAYAGNNLQRPITSSSPAVDKYSNGWQVGLSLSYNIASLYGAPRNIKLSKLQVDQVKEQSVLIIQNKEVSINAAYVAYSEAIVRTEVLEKNVSLANENYRIIEKKYLNQLALLIDMLDASNAKIDAELRLANSSINVLYNYSRLLAETGTL